MLQIEKIPILSLMNLCAKNFRLITTELCFPHKPKIFAPIIKSNSNEVKSFSFKWLKVYLFICLLKQKPMSSKLGDWTK